MNQLGLESAYADTTIASAPQNIIDAITKQTIPDIKQEEIYHHTPTAQEKVITKDSVIKPAKHVMELVTNTGERRAKPIRMPASAFFNINSIDRYASATNPTAQFALINQPYQILNANPASSYDMYLGRNLMSGYFHRLCVTDVNIQWNIPTINSQNYIFSMTQFNGESYTAVNVIIPIGYYSFTDMALILQGQIRLAFAATSAPLDNFTVTWLNSQNPDFPEYAFVFDSVADGVEICFNDKLVEESGGVIPGLIPGTSNIQANRSMYKFYNMMGIASILINVYNSAPILQTTPSYPTLIYTSYVDVISNKLSQFMRVKDSETSWAPDTSVITRIYLTNQGTITAPTISQLGTTTFEEFGVGSRAFILNYTPTTPKYIKWDPAQALIDFDIRVVDEFGDVLPWSQYTKFGNIYFTEFFEFTLTVLCSET